MKNITKLMFTCLLMTMTYAQSSDDTTPDSDTTEQMNKPMMGGSSRTYAPQSFAPNQKYIRENPNYVGNYFVSSQRATIHDPSITEDNGYDFINVVSFQPRSGQDMNRQELNGKKLIGHIKSNPATSANGKIKSHAMRLPTLLFGELQK